VKSGGYEAEFSDGRKVSISVGNHPYRKSVCLFVMRSTPGEGGVLDTVAYFRNEAEADTFSDALRDLIHAARLEVDGGHHDTTCMASGGLF